MQQGRHKVKIEKSKEIRISGVCGFIERKVTSFGTGAKVDCLKEFIGKKVYLVIVEDDTTNGCKINGN